MEVRIGVTYSARELTFQSAQAAADVEAAVSSALADGTVLRLEDEKGRRYLVPAAKIAYVELGSGDQRRVGFA